MTTLRIVIAAWAIVASSVALAERGRPIILSIPENVDVSTLADAWNDNLGRDFDLVSNAPGAPDIQNTYAFNKGRRAIWVRSLEETANLAPEDAESVQWLIFDMREYVGDPAGAASEVERFATRNRWRLALVPPADMAEDWAQILAPFAHAYIIPIEEISQEAIPHIQTIANIVTKTNGRSRIGVWMDASGIEEQGDLVPLLEFINTTDEFIHFYAARWPNNTATLTTTLEVLNVDIEGPQPSEGMHQDRFRPPDEPLDPRTEERMRFALSIASIISLVAVGAIVLFYKRPRGGTNR